MDSKETKIITIASIKGGVGKSTTALFFSDILANRGFKVLLIDSDPQASTTSYFSNKLEDMNINSSDTNLYKVLKKQISMEKSILKINSNLSLLPSHLELDQFSEESIPRKDDLLNRNLSFIKNDYNYIIIDTAPTLSSLLNNSLIITDYLLVPVPTDQWAIESLTLLKKRLKDIFREDLKIYTLITNLVERQNIDKELKTYIESEFKDEFLGSVLKRDNLRKNIFYREQLNKNEDYYKAYEDIVDNLLFLSKTK